MIDQTTKNQEFKTYFCPWTNSQISGIGARNCNYCDIETYVCRHDNKPCVAKLGLEQFAEKIKEELSARNITNSRGKNFFLTDCGSLESLDSDLPKNL